MTFTHAPVKRAFQYDRTKEKSLAALAHPDAQDGTLHELTKKSPYADIGPFADWKIEVPRDLNPDLPYDAISDVLLEFHGGSRT